MPLLKRQSPQRSSPRYPFPFDYAHITGNGLYRLPVITLDKFGRRRDADYNVAHQWMVTYIPSLT